MAKTEMIGTWFPSGYHGHFRSKSRSDFINEYRHLAKPIPPKKFVVRAKEKATRHVFSRHDNRHSFLNDALYFEEGLGRRRIKSDTQSSNRHLLTWMPTKTELVDKATPMSSVYSITFRGYPGQPIRQHIVKRPKTSFDDDSGVTTSYRYAHGLTNPNRELLNVMSNTGLNTVPNRRIRASTAHPNRESVASCMSWHAPIPPAKPRPQVPCATNVWQPESSPNMVNQPEMSKTEPPVVAVME